MSTTLSVSIHSLLVVSIVLDDTVHGAKLPSSASASSRCHYPYSITCMPLSILDATVHTRLHVYG